MIKKWITAGAAAVSLLAALLVGSPQSASADVPKPRPAGSPLAPGLPGAPPKAMPGAKPVTTGLVPLSQLRGGKGAVPDSSPSGVHANVRGGPNYFYAGGVQTGISPTVTSATSILTVGNPYINNTYDYHTLAEMAVQSTDSHNTVEIGWTKDQDLYGDLKPRLFSFCWVASNPCGPYNGGGYVDNPAESTFAAGMDVTSYIGAATAPVFGIVHDSGNWWVSFDGHYLGYYPDSIWTGHSPTVAAWNAGRASYFGEVAGGSATPCADMAAAPTSLPTSTSGPGSLGNMGYSTGTSTIPKVSFSYSGQYDATYKQTAAGPPPVYSVRSFWYGGGGFC